MRPLTKYLLPGRPRPGIHAARIFISAKRRLYEERIAIMQRKHARFVPKANRVLGSEQGDALSGGSLFNRRWPVVCDALQNRSTDRDPKGVSHRVCSPPLYQVPLIRTDVPNCAGRWT